MNIIYEIDVDKAFRVLVITNKLPKEHIHLKLIIKASLKIGGYKSISFRLSSPFNY